MKGKASRKRGGPSLKRMQAVQQRLHTLHAMMRARLALAEQANTDALLSFGRDFRVREREMSLEEEMNVFDEVHQMRDREKAMVPLLMAIVDLEELIETMRLFENMEWEENEHKLFHLRKILLLLITMYLLQHVLIFEELQAEELGRLQRKLPGWF